MKKERPTMVLMVVGTPGNLSSRGWGLRKTQTPPFDAPLTGVCGSQILAFYDQRAKLAWGRMKSAVRGSVSVGPTQSSLEQYPKSLLDRVFCSQSWGLFFGLPGPPNLWLSFWAPVEALNKKKHPLQKNKHLKPSKKRVPQNPHIEVVARFFPWVPESP